VRCQILNDEKTVQNAIIEYVLDNHITSYTKESIPMDESLVELGVIDSYGVVELVDYLERNWSISIEDSEITREKMGSINKMTTLVLSKTGVTD
jgi:acyl carrier protein